MKKNSKNQNILIKSTSFLMNATEPWKSLKNFNVKFSNYGNLFEASKNNDSNFEIIIIFIEDLIASYLNQKKYFNSEKKKLNSILDIIKKKITISQNTKHIVFFSSYSYLNIINSLKSKESNTKLYDHFDECLYKLSKSYPNLFVVNLDNIFAKEGYKKCFDTRNYYTFRCRLSLFGLNILIKKIKEVIENIITPNKKALLLDCDNTLWGGILGEDGYQEILIGQDGLGNTYSDFQRAIKKIKDSGIILILLSKNNEKDVKDVFKKHKSMVLKNSDIAVYKVNWKEKSQNILDLSKELSLNTNSFVFWDDNFLEREKVKKNFKDIYVIEPDKEVSNWPKQLLEYSGFSKFITTNEDQKKTEQYQARNLFLESKSSSNNEINFLSKLKIKPKMVKIDKSNVSRASQLSIKTNQFNFNLKRLKTNQLMVKTKNQNYFVVKLDDSLGDHGYIALLSLKKENKFMFVDQFLISCRVLGRYLENWIINELKTICKKEKINKLFFEYTKSEYNQVTLDFINSNNFSLLSKNEISLYNKKKKLLSNNSKIYSLNLNEKINYLEVYGKK